MDHQIFGDYRSFFLDLLSKLKTINIDLKNYPVDHFCYRVASAKDYLKMKEKTKNISKAYLENIHHNRPISKFILKEPLKFDKYSVDVMELPAPKSSQFFQTGLEHFEFSVGKKFVTFKEKYKKIWNGFDDSGPYNQPVFIRFDNNTVKFHEFPLLTVLELEGKKFIDL